MKTKCTLPDVTALATSLSTSLINLALTNSTQSVEAISDSVLDSVLTSIEIENKEKALDAIIEKEYVNTIKDILDITHESIKTIITDDYSKNLSIVIEHLDIALSKSVEDKKKKLRPIETSSTVKNDSKKHTERSESTAESLETDGDDYTGEAPKITRNEDIVGEARIIKRIDANSMNDVFKHFLVGDLRLKAADLTNLFQDLVAKFWMSTEVIGNRSYFEFDSNIIKKNIKKELARIVSNYYKKIANKSTHITYSLNNASEFHTNSVYFYTDIAKMPLEATELSTIISQDTGEKYSIYSAKGIKSDDNEPIFFIVSESEDTDLKIVIDLITAAINKGITASALQAKDLAFTEFTMEQNLDLPAVSRASVQNFVENKNMTSAYFAKVIDSQLDAFINDNAEMLNDTFKEIFRDGPVDSDIIGSDMTNKLLKLTLINSPLLHEEINSELKSAALRDQLTTGKSVSAALKSTNAVVDVDSDGTKLFSFTAKIQDPFDISPDPISVVFTSFVLNVGTEKIVLAYSDATNWILPISLNNDILTYSDTNENSLSGDNLKIFNLVKSNLNKSRTGIVTELYEEFTNMDVTSADAAELISSFTSNKIKSSSVNLMAKDGNEKYLVESMVDLAADIFYLIPKNVSGAATFLKNIFENQSNTKNRKYATVARSIYYRFFHKGTYTITSVDPTSRLLQKVEHKSLYEQSRSNSNQMAGKAVNALLSKLSATAVDNKGFYENGIYSETNIQGASDFAQFINNIDLVKTSTTRSGQRVLRAKISDNFKVEKEGEAILIRYYNYGSSVGVAPDFTYKLIRDSGVNNYRVVFDGNTSESVVNFKTTILKSIASKIGLPTNLLNSTFIDNLFKSLGVTGEPVESFDTFFGTLIALRLANAVDRPGDVFYKPLTDIFTADNSSQLDYTFDKNMFKYNAAIKEALEKTAGRDVNTQVRAPAGILQMIQITNAGKRKEEIIRNIRTAINEQGDDSTNLARYSKFVTGILTLHSNGVTKGGIKNKDVGKANKDLTASEQSTYYLDGAQLQKAAMENFQKFNSMEGTQSDRSQSMIFSVSSSEFDILPVAKANDKSGERILDEVSIRNAYKSTMFNSFRGLSEHLLKRWKPIILDILNGNIAAGYNEAYFDRYAAASPELTLEQIKESIVSNTTTLRQLHALLNGLELNVKEMLHLTGLNKNLDVTKDALGNANINYSLVQLSEIFFTKDEKYTAVQDFYIELYKKKYIKYMTDSKTGAVLSNDMVETIANRFNIVGNYKTKKAKALDIALRSQFYIDSIGEQELAMLGAGSVFQYGTKDASIVEVIDLTLTPNATVEEKLDMLESIDVAGLDKTISEVSYEEIKALGSYGNNISHIKTILDAENLTDANKWELIKYNDSATQITTMYIDRVKRNQALGSSAVLLVLADESIPGIIMPTKTRSLVIADPRRDVYSLSSGTANISVYDGPTYNSGAYMYALNSSLGDDFSNYRNDGTAKTVNASRDDSGALAYEKTANFPQFNPELQLYGTPRFSNLTKTMMSAIAFKDDYNDYTGLFLDDDVFNPGSSKFDVATSATQLLENIDKYDKYDEVLVASKGKKLLLKDFASQYAIDENFRKTVDKSELFLNKTLLNADTILKHGAYIGEAYLNGTRINIGELIYEYEEGRISKDDLNAGVTTSKKFISGDIIKNKYDLFNYYGNVAGDSTKYNSMKTDAERDTLRKLYPFGWAEYQITHIMSGFRGENNTHPIRNSAVNKVIFESALKTGASHINSAEAMTNSNFDYSKLKIKEMSNKFLGVLLKATHNPDTTAEYNMSEEMENNQAAATTQAHAAAIFQGESIIAAEQMYDAIGLISELSLKSIETDIASYDADAKRLQVSSDKLFMVDVAKETIATRKDPGATGEALGRSIDESVEVAADVKMLRPFLRSAVNAKFDKKVVKLRYKGGQYILAPIEDQVKTYRYNNASGLFRSALNSNNSINGIISEAVKESNKTKESVKLPKEWDLVNVESVAQFKTDHNPSDLVYIYNKDSTLTQIPALELLKDERLLNSLIESNELVSPWVSTLEHKARTVEGDMLNWIKYYRDGKELYETDEFLSFLLAGKAPIDLGSKISKILITEDLSELTTLYSDIIGYFKNESNFGEETLQVVPSTLWARFKIETGVNAPNGLDLKELALTPVLGKNVIERLNLDNRSDANDTMLKFMEWIGTQSNPKVLASLLTPQLKSILDEPGWSTKPSEFYMPPHHQAAFLMDYGDNLQDMVGIQEQPDLIRLASILVEDEEENRLKALLSEEEIYVLEINYDSNKEEVIAIKEKIAKLGGEEGAKFLKLRDAQQAHMVHKYFLPKINKIEDSVAKEGVSLLTSNNSRIRKGILKRAPLFLLKSVQSIDQAKELLQELLTEEAVISNETIYANVLELQELIYSNEELTINNFNAKLTTMIEDFKLSWAKTLANNLEKSLTFMTTRIPTQGKQQVTVGKIKNFIYSTKNNIYAPLELFAMSGADYDIDKQSNITWDVTSSGAIIDWRQWVTDPSVVKAPTLKEIDAVIIEKYDRFMESLDRNEALSEEEKDKLGRNFERAQYSLASRAVQNFSLEKMLAVYKDSKNAMESATMVAMTKIGKIANYLDSFKFNEEDIAEYNLEVEEQVIGTRRNHKTNQLEDIIKTVLVPSEKLFEAIENRNHALPFSPSVKLLYEKVNMDGKNGIPIFASGLKGYSAAYYATVNNAYTKAYNAELKTKRIQGKISEGVSAEEIHNIVHSTVIKQELVSFEMDMMKLNIKQKDIQELENDLPEELPNTNIKPYFFIRKDMGTGLYSLNANIDYLANTKKHIPNSKNIHGKLSTELAKESYKQLRFATSIEEEVRIINKFKDAANLHSDMNLEAPAWADLSELLSAATDNAKELILSKIGANSTTSSTIVAMLVMGIDLVDALMVLNDQDVKEAVAAYEEQSNLVKEEVNVVERLNVILNNTAEKYTKNLDSRTTELIKNVLINENSKLETPINSDIINQLDTQITNYLINKDYTLVDAEFNYIIDNVNYGDLIVDSINEINKQLKYLKHYNPAKQVELYLRAANDFTSLASQLKINTGMENLERDVLNYIIKIESGLKKLFTFEQFLNAVEQYENDKPKDLMHILNKVNEKKGALNIPFILFKNKHFLASLKAVKRSNKMMASSSYSSRIIHSTLRSKLWGAVTPEDFSAFNTALDSMAINLFYKDASSVKSISVKNFGNYDLTKASSKKGEEKSRLDFVLDAPDIIQDYIQLNKDLSSNELLKLFGRTKDINDPTTGLSISLLSGIEIHNTPRSKISILKLALDNIKVDHPKLYNILLQYSLIVDKAGLGANSIASLFGAEPYAEYFAFVNKLEKSGDMDNIFKEMKIDILSLIFPSLLKKVSTKTDVTNKDLFYINNSENSDLSQEEISRLLVELTNNEYLNSTEEEIQDKEEEIRNFSIEDYTEDSKSELAYKYYDSIADVSDMNALMLEYESTDRIPKVFRSITNGLIYAWNPLLKSYIPITKGLPVDVGTMSGSIGMRLDNSLTSIGMDYGWEITVPYSPNKGRLLMHDGTKYIVQDANNTFKRFSAEEILTSNPTFILQGNSIRVNYKKHNLKDSTKYIVDKDGNILTTQKQYKNKNTKTVTVNMGNDIFKTENDRAYVNANLKETIEEIPVIEDLNIEASTIRDNIDNVYYTQFKNFVSAVVHTFDRANKHTKTKEFEETFKEAMTTLASGKYLQLSDQKTPLLRSFFNKNIDSLLNNFKTHDEGFANMYTLLRSDPETAIHYVATSLNLNKINKDKLPELMNGFLKNSNIKDYVQLSTTQAPMSIDKEILANTDVVKHMFIDKYVSILDKVGISIEDYRKLNGIDALSINNILYYDDNLVRNKSTKFSEGLTTNYYVPNNIKKLKIKKLSKKLISKLGKFLNDRFEGTTVEVLSIADLKILHPDIDITSTTEAFVKTSSGTIVLIQERASLDTLLHEMTHLYLAELKEVNIELYVNIMEKMKSDPLYEEAMSKYQSKQDYDDLSILEEIFVTKMQSMHAYAFAEKVAEEAGDTDLYNAIFNKNNSDNILNTYQNLFESFFGKDIKTPLTMEDSIFDIMQKIGMDIIFFKKSPNMNMFTSNDRKDMKLIISDSLPRSVIDRIFKKLHYTEKQC